MPTFACKDCNGTVSTSAAACPHCGAKVPPPQGKQVNPKVTAGIFAAVAVFIVVYAFTHLDATPPVSYKPDPNAHVPHVSVEISRTTIRVTNIDTTSWSEVSVYINGGPPSGYHATTTAPAPGQSVTMLLNDFVNSDNDRFDPYAKKVSTAMVGGGGYDYCSFDH